MNPPINRLRELDFLRGIAIVLVLLRHQELFDFTTNMGWIGVDLFFVLSGFLVSGLLFKEYLKFGNIQPGNFLIRRGFKIYPIYYIFYWIYLIPLVLHESFKIIPFLSDMVFLQNYVYGWGYAYSASWTLAIEEHFYFGLALVLWYGIKKNKFRLVVGDGAAKIGQVEKIIFSVMLICFVLRVLQNCALPFLYSDEYMALHHGRIDARNFAMTHLRIDSLLAGVLVSYLYYFRLNLLKTIYQRYKKWGLLLVAGLLAYTPFIDAVPSFFVKTIGFTMVFTAFAIVLVYFLLAENINGKLNRIFSRPLVNIISKIGVYSYSIYIIHSFMIIRVEKMGIENQYLAFALSFILSVIVGKWMTDYIEKYFLRIRDKYYPSRTA